MCVRNEEVLLLSGEGQCKFEAVCWDVYSVNLLLSALKLNVTSAFALRSSRGVPFKCFKNEVTQISLLFILLN